MSLSQPNDARTHDSSFAEERQIPYSRGSRKGLAFMLPLAKELRLQRSNLLLLLGVILCWALLWIAALTPQRQVAGFKMIDIVGGLHLVGVQSCLLFFLPLMFGATAVAAERQLGVLDWQLAVPRTRAVQLLVKSGVALGLAAFTGGVLSLVLDWALPARDYIQLLFFPDIWPGTYSVFVAAVALSTSVNSRDSARALVAAVPVLMLTGLFIYFGDPALLLLPPLGFVQTETWAEHLRFVLLAALLLGFGAWNFRPQPVTRMRMLQQYVALAVAAFVITVAEVHVIRRVDLHPSPSVTGAQPSFEYRTLMAQPKPGHTVAPPTSVRHWTSGGATSNPFRLTLLAGEDSSWLESLAYPEHGTRFPGQFYKSPEQRLVALAGEMGPDRFEKSIYTLHGRGVWFDLEVDRGATRQFPGAGGELVEFPGQHTYKIKLGSRSFLAGRFPFVTLPVNTTSTSNQAAFDQSVPGYDPAKHAKLIVQSRDGYQRAYRLEATSGSAARPGVTLHAHAYEGIPKHLVMLSANHLNPDVTTRTLHTYLLRLEDRTQLAEIIKVSPRNVMYGFWLIDPAGRWIASRHPENPNATASYDILIQGLAPEGQLTGTSWTIPALGKYIHVDSASDYHWGTHLAENRTGSSRLTISNDGKYLAAVRRETAWPIIPQWYEVLTLNLENGEIRSVGGFPTSTAYGLHLAHKRAADSRRPPSESQDQARMHERALYNPRFAWSPSGKLVVLSNNDLYIFDPDAPIPAGDAASPTFTHLDIDRTVSRDLAFWDEKTLLLMGDRSIWKLNGHF